LHQNRIDLVRGYASFLDAYTVTVNGETLTAEHILIATERQPVHPAIPGAEYGIDSDGFSALQELPRRVAVVDAGYVAAEIAGVLRALGNL